MLPVPMVGRTDELAELTAAWSRLVATPTAGPSTAVLTGAAGTGKSLLVRTALDGFEPAPVTVLSGTARVHTPAPYDWLAAVLSTRAGDVALPDDVRAWLAQEPGPPAHRYAPGALLRLAVRAVRLLVGDGPAVVVAEDLHGLDPASLNLLGELATSAGLRALLLVTSRPAVEAVSPRLAARTLGRLAKAPGAVRIQLGPLGEAEVAALLERAHGGNPYWLSELLAIGGGGMSAALHAARDHLAAGLPETALRAVEVGLRSGHADRDPLPLLRVGAAAATAAARFADAAGYAARWLAIAPADDLVDRAAAHRTFATACGRLGRQRECEAQLAAARELLAEAGADREDSEWARYLAASAEAKLGAGAAAEAARQASRALDLVGSDATTEGAATVTLAAAMAAMDKYEPSRALLRTARRTAAERRDLDTLGRAIGELITVHLPRLDEPAAWHVFDEVVATTTRYGLEHDTGRAILAGVRLATRVGNATRARELISARLPVEPDPARCAVLAASAGLLAVERGDAKQAREQADRADSEAAAAADTGAVATAALLRVALGKPIEEYGRRVPAAYDRRSPDRLIEAARMALSAGTPPARVRELLRGRIDGPEPGRSRSQAQLVCALLAAEGDDEGAIAAGAIGLDGLPEIAWLDADTHLTIARCLLRLDRIEDARRHAKTASDLLERWPGGLAKRITEFTGTLDAAPMPAQRVPGTRAAEAGGDLTAREREVLSCLAAGMSNKQVARSLGISVRTVTVHVSNLLRKTRSSSRTEAALWALRHLELAERA